ncbi:MAG: DUF4097 family beta strand repeat-containing protein [Bacteroidota bacterium]
MRGLFVVLLCFPWFIQAQPEVVRQVVTKTIEDTYQYKPGNEVAVEGEKAEIFVETWAKNEINIRLEMTAKHADLETAKRDLENLTFTTEKAGMKYFLKNSRLDKKARPKSELIVHYYITLPEECPVYLKSHFGAATISNLKNRLRINGEYSQINIDNVQGLLDIRTRFGDIFGEKIDGNVVINSRRSDIELIDVGGSFLINAQYGELKLSPNARLADLQINAEKSDVYLFDPTGSPLSYALTTTNGKMNLPGELPIVVLEESETTSNIRINSTREVVGQVKVSVAFGNLYFEKQEREVARRKSSY